MKSLLLLRHAQSADKQPGQRDFDRVLTAAGQAQANRVGEYLNKKSIRPDLVLCSNAVRASSTTTIVSSKIEYSLDKIIEIETIYEASLASLLSIIKGIEDRFNCVLLVGHNPSISTLGEFFIDEHVGNVEPAGLLSIEFSFPAWKEVARGSGKLLTITNA
jgi:phosphohistidine phosphatase